MLNLNFTATYNTKILFQEVDASLLGAADIVFIDSYFSENEKFKGLPNAIFIAGGELVKTPEAILDLVNICLKAKIKKSGGIIAVGGGALLDAVGFLGSILHRGIDITYVPTTLLAMVDSSVGGKTGINSELGKNTLGAIYPASNIVIDVGFLNTLTPREYASGMAEVIKYEIISGRDLTSLSELEKIKQCIEIKNEYCSDLLDKGKRRILNYGHTLGHALESLMPGRYTHGEAVGLGMIFAAQLQRDEELVTFTADKLKKYDLPFEIPHLNPQVFLRQMKLDKKCLSDRVNFVVKGENGFLLLREFSDDYVLECLKKCSLKKD